jgi:hypothetical protein
MGSGSVGPEKPASSVAYQRLLPNTNVSGAVSGPTLTKRSGLLTTLVWKTTTLLTNSPSREGTKRASTVSCRMRATRVCGSMTVLLAKTHPSQPTNAMGVSPLRTNTLATTRSAAAS